MYKRASDSDAHFGFVGMSYNLGSLLTDIKDRNRNFEKANCWTHKQNPVEVESLYCRKA